MPIHKPCEYIFDGFSEWYSKPIKEYAGSSTEAYFELVRFMQSGLFYPAILGVLTILINQLYGYTADNSPMDSIYALGVVLWGVYFVSKW